MAKFEVGQRVRVKSDIDSDYAGQVAVVLALHGSGPIVVVGDDSRLMYLESELEPIVTFQPGDIVCAKKGDAITQDALRTIGSIETLWLREWRLSDYEEKGYSLTLVKRPELEIVLPTKNSAIIKTEDDVYILTKLGWANVATLRRVGTEDLKVSLGFVDEWKIVFAGEGENE